MPRKWDPRDPPTGDHDPDAWKKMSNDMHAWGQELEKWGKRVRRDIIALEDQRDFLACNPGLKCHEYEAEFLKIAQQAHEKVGLEESYQAGDPDDPPPPPWKKK